MYGGGSGDLSSVADVWYKKITSAGPGVGGVSMDNKIVKIGSKGGVFEAPRYDITTGGPFDTTVVGKSGYMGWYTPEELERVRRGLISRPEVDWQDVWKEKRLELLRGSGESLAKYGTLPETVQLPHRLIEIAEQYKVSPEAIFSSETAAAMRKVMKPGESLSGLLARSPEVGGRVNIKNLMEQIAAADLAPLFKYQDPATRAKMIELWGGGLPAAEIARMEAEAAATTPYKRGGTTRFDVSQQITWPYPPAIAGREAPDFPSGGDSPFTGVPGGRYVMSVGGQQGVSPWLLGAAGGGLLLTSAAGQKKEEEQ